MRFTKCESMHMYGPLHTVSFDPNDIMRKLRLTEFNQLYAQERVFKYIASSIIRFVQT